jgi:putative phosphoesterase
MGHYTARLERGFIGLIADTHGKMRPEALAALQGVELIIHAGDVGSPEVLQALETLAPVVAIRGNNDRGPWADTLFDTMLVELGQIAVYVPHDVKTLGTLPSRAIKAVIAGHSHRPKVERHNDVLFVNPGSAGPRRFKLPVAVAHMWIQDSLIDAAIIPLDM